MLLRLIVAYKNNKLDISCSFVDFFRFSSGRKTLQFWNVKTWFRSVCNQLAAHANNQKWLPCHKRRKDLKKREISEVCYAFFFLLLCVRTAWLFMSTFHQHHSLCCLLFFLFIFCARYVSFPKVEERRRKDRDSCTNSIEESLFDGGEEDKLSKPLILNCFVLFSLHLRLVSWALL